VGASMSHNPMGLHGGLQGELYLYDYDDDDDDDYYYYYYY
jgi:hypothetical protein